MKFLHDNGWLLVFFPTVPLYIYFLLKSQHYARILVEELIKRGVGSFGPNDRYFAFTTEKKLNKYLLNIDERNELELKHLISMMKKYENYSRAVIIILPPVFMFLYAYLWYIYETR